MATLYIEEYQRIGSAPYGGQMQAPLGSTDFPSTNQPPLTISGSPTTSQNFKNSTVLIRVHTDAICSIKVGGQTPVASTSNMRLAANQTEYFSVQNGDALSVIANV